jgi:hypothetical protein
MSSEIVKATPQGLRDFAETLRKFKEEVQSIETTVGAKLDRLGKSSWKDKQYEAFKKAFDALFTRLKDFGIQADEEMKHLEARAKDLQKHIDKLEEL